MSSSFNLTTSGEYSFKLVPVVEKKPAKIDTLINTDNKNPATENKN